MSDSEKPQGKWPDAERRSGRKRRDEQDRRRAVWPRFEGDAGHDPVERRKHARRSGVERRDEGAWQNVPLEPVPAMSIGGEAELLAAAVEARTRAHARYSRFKVGAALETVDQVIVTGCNIENATYGLTMCAERVALVKALSDGHDIFTRIVVVADTESPTPPCGSCRQLLWEYCGDIDVILGNPGGVTERYRLSALLPLPFDRRFL